MAKITRRAFMWVVAAAASCFARPGKIFADEPALPLPRPVPDPEPELISGSLSSPSSRAELLAIRDRAEQALRNNCGFGYGYRKDNGFEEDPGRPLGFVSYRADASIRADGPLDASAHSKSLARGVPNSADPRSDEARRLAIRAEAAVLSGCGRAFCFSCPLPPGVGFSRLGLHE